MYETKSFFMPFQFKGCKFESSYSWLAFLLDYILMAAARFREMVFSFVVSWTKRKI